MKRFTGSSEPEKTNTPPCPECGSSMISRVSKKNGRRFWGCRRFPECRGTRNTDGESSYERERTLNENERDDE